MSKKITKSILEGRILMQEVDLALWREKWKSLDTLLRVIRLLLPEEKEKTDDSL